MDKMSSTHLPEPAASPLLYSVPVACARLGGVSRSWLYLQTKAGRIQTRKMGRRTMLVAADVDRLAANGVVE